MANWNSHPSDEEIAAFLDGGLSAGDRASVARHLAECDDCRSLLGAAAEPAALRLLAGAQLQVGDGTAVAGRETRPQAASLSDPGTILPCSGCRSRTSG